MTEAEKLTPAQNARRAFEKRMEAEGVKYRSEEERPVVRVKYSGKSFEEITLTFLFDEDGKSASLTVYSVASFPKDRMEDAMELCNRLNQTYRWLRFFVDRDCELAATADLAFPIGAAATVCFEMLSKSVSVLNAVCEELL